MVGCLLAAATFYFLGQAHLTSPTWVASELFLTILGLFFLGSFRYQLDKNALTYGMCGVLIATFIPLWWPSSALKGAWTQEGVGALTHFVQDNFLTLHGLESLIHADTMLFILGLTYFVSVI